LRKSALLIRGWTSQLRSPQEYNRTCALLCNCGLSRLDSSHPIALVGQDSRESLWRPPSALPVTRLLETYGLYSRSCDRQLTQLDGNLSNLIDVANDSLRVLVDEAVAIDFD